MPLDDLRAKAYEMLRTKAGEKFLPVRLARGVLVFVNDMAGRPLAPKDELDERRDYERRRVEKIAAHATRMAAERAAEAAEDKAAAAAKRQAAPVVVYVDDNSTRELKRISDVLRGRDIPFTQADVQSDDATRSWVYTTAKVNELPLVFVAGQPIGGFNELVQADATGELVKLVFG